MARSAPEWGPLTVHSSGWSYRPQGGWMTHKFSKSELPANWCPQILLRRLMFYIWVQISSVIQDMTFGESPVERSHQNWSNMSWAKLSNSSRIEHMDYKTPFCDQFDSGHLIVLTSDIALTSDTGDRWTCEQYHPVITLSWNATKYMK